MSKGFKVSCQAFDSIGFTAGKVYEASYEDGNEAFLEITADDDGLKRLRPAYEFAEYLEPEAVPLPVVHVPKVYMACMENVQQCASVGEAEEWIKSQGSGTWRIAEVVKTVRAKCVSTVTLEDV